MSTPDDRAYIVPPSLSPGDTIAFVAPAGVLDEERMSRARRRLEERGYNVQVPKNLYRQRGYLAGRDEERAAELMRAFEDPDVDAIFPGTGSYGATRILDLLDFEKIRANPKVLIGFSDITALHLAINQEARLVTFHTPNPMWGLGSKSNLPKYAAKYFWSCLEGDALSSSTEYEPPKADGKLQILSPGTATGQLVGGNLSLIIALMGTPYEIDCRDKILFIEDIKEAPYRIDRYLCQLKLAGKLDEAAGILVGKFTKCETKDPENNLTLRQVFEDYFSDLDIPVVTNFPAGHVSNNATLPLGGFMAVQTNPLKIQSLPLHGH